MELIVITLLVILFSVIDFFIYMKIKENFVNRSSMLTEEYEKTKEHYEKLKQEIKGLKLELEEHEKKYVMLKNREVDKIIEKKSSKPTEIDILLEEKMVSPSDIKKAQEFIKNNNSPFSVTDVLVLLGKLDVKKAEIVKSKLSGTY